MAHGVLLDFLTKHLTCNSCRCGWCYLDAAAARYAVTRDLVVTEFTYLQFYIAMGCFYSERCYG